MKYSNPFLQQPDETREAWQLRCNAHAAWIKSFPERPYEREHGETSQAYTLRLARLQREIDTLQRELDMMMEAEEICNAIYMGALNGLRRELE